MKLQFDAITVERSGKFQTQNFDIGNKRIILEILRGKMYSNPIQTICQEIMSNARDAHREVGKHNLPIVVKLPNTLDPSFYIKDFGPGITPERMADVFIKYGESTKRDDNIQSGGFGLGAKSPFSYTDTFSVISVTPENNQLVRREYIAHIDESGLGQMSCVKEEVTTDQQGTTIVISPKTKNDYDAFKKYTLRSGLYWSTHPTVVGDPEWKWPAIDVTHKGDRWEIHKRINYYEYQSISAEPCAIIDGIPYPIKLHHLFTHEAPPYPRIRDLALRLYFEVGEIPITANREDIDYQPRSIQILEERLKKVFEEILSQKASLLTTCASLKQAIITWQKYIASDELCRHIGIPLTWNTIDINRAWKFQPLTDEAHIYKFSRHDDTFKPNKVNRPIEVNDYTLFVEDDQASIKTSRQRLATIFDANTNINVIYLFSFYRKLNKEDEITLLEQEDYLKRKALFETNYHWSLLEPIKLYAFEKTGAKPKTKTVPTVRKFGTYTWEGQPIPIETLKATPDIKLYIEPTGHRFLLNKTLEISARELSDIVSKLRELKITLPLYCVNSRSIAHIDKNWTPLYEHIQTIMNAFVAQNGAITDENIRDRPEDHFSVKVVSLIYTSLHKIINSNSPFKLYFEKAKALSTYKTTAGPLISLANICKIDTLKPGQVNTTLSSLFKAVYDNYPLFKSINMYTSHGLDQTIDELIFYVNMKDERRNQITP